MSWYPCKLKLFNQSILVPNISIIFIKSLMVYGIQTIVVFVWHGKVVHIVGIVMNQWVNLILLKFVMIILVSSKKSAFYDLFINLSTNLLFIFVQRCTSQRDWTSNIPTYNGLYWSKKIFLLHHMVMYLMPGLIESHTFCQKKDISTIVKSVVSLWCHGENFVVLWSEIAFHCNMTFFKSWYVKLFIRLETYIL